MNKFKKIELKDLLDQDEDFVLMGPEECMDCGYTEDFIFEHYISWPEADKDYDILEEAVKKELGFSEFSVSSSSLGLIIIVTKCSKCGSEDVFLDF